MSDPSLEEILIHTKVVYQGKYLRTEERVVKLPDGTESMREIVVPPDAVGILALDCQERVHLVRQYRAAIRQITLEIPAGLLEPGESAEETAKRECEEEIGFKPGRLEFLFSYHHSVGFSTGKIHVFLATDLVESPEAHADPHEFLKKMTLPFSELYKNVLSGEIMDSKTLLAALWYQQRKRSPR